LPPNVRLVSDSSGAEGDERVRRTRVSAGAFFRLPNEVHKAGKRSSDE
jgi:hypothetical protein